jgi:Lipid A 3-O-deacylase (PagL)
MSVTETTIRRLEFRDKSRGNHRCRIGMTFLAATLAGLICEFPARAQATAAIAANAFRPSGALVRAIQPAGEIDQGPQTGAYELQFWSAGGDGVRIAPSNPKGRFWNIGIRFGYVLTGEHGPGPLRGRFEYVADVIPVIQFHFPGQTAWGGGIVPVGMKWDFVTRHRIAPYAEVNGGGLVTNNDVPPGGSMLNFTASGSLGVHVLRGKFSWSVEARFYHISNGCLAPNPSFNTLGLSVGPGTFFRSRGNEN